MLPGLSQKLVTGGRKCADFLHPDPDSMCSRQLSMIAVAQTRLRKEMDAGLRADSISLSDIQMLEKLSNSLVRAIEALKKSSDLAGELASRLTPEQLLEAALAKIEGQDVPTLRYAVKRLRAHMERMAPSPTTSAVTSATDAIAALA